MQPCHVRLCIRPLAIRACGNTPGQNVSNSSMAEPFQEIHHLGAFQTYTNRTVFQTCSKHSFSGTCLVRILPFQDLAFSGSCGEPKQGSTRKKSESCSEKYPKGTRTETGNVLAIMYDLEDRAYPSCRSIVPVHHHRQASTARTAHMLAIPAGCNRS